MRGVFTRLALKLKCRPTPDVRELNFFNINISMLSEKALFGTNVAMILDREVVVVIFRLERFSRSVVYRQY